MVVFLAKGALECIVEFVHASGTLKVCKKLIEKVRAEVREQLVKRKGTQVTCDFTSLEMGAVRPGD